MCIILYILLNLYLPIILPIVLAFVIVLFLAIHSFRRESRSVITISFVLLLLFSASSFFYTVDFITFDAKGERIPMYYLMWNIFGDLSFYYGSPINPFTSIAKALNAFLFCGYKDSKTAYEKYKELLTNSGFSIEEQVEQFTARNETTLVYCQLEGNFIMVVEVNKDEEDLLARSEISKGRIVLK